MADNVEELVKQYSRPSSSDEEDSKPRKKTRASTGDAPAARDLVIIFASTKKDRYASQKAKGFASALEDRFEVSCWKPTKKFTTPARLYDNYLLMDSILVKDNIALKTEIYKAMLLGKAVYCISREPIQIEDREIPILWGTTDEIAARIL